MKRKKKRTRRDEPKTGQPDPDARTRRKISQMLWEFAGDYIRMGRTLEHRQHLLHAACTAWNIASAPADRRPRLFERYMSDFKRLNPKVDAEQLAAVRSDMEKLIAQKLKLFPLDQRQIVGARIVRVGDNERIEAAAVSVEP